MTYYPKWVRRQWQKPDLELLNRKANAQLIVGSSFLYRGAIRNLTQFSDELPLVRSLQTLLWSAGYEETS